MGHTAMLSGEAAELLGVRYTGGILMLLLLIICALCNLLFYCVMQLMHEGWFDFNAGLLKEFAINLGRRLLSNPITRGFYTNFEQISNETAMSQRVYAFEQEYQS